MKKNKTSFVERRFLNQGAYHSLAAVSCTFDIDQETFDNGTWGAFETSFAVSDCNRIINLDLDMSDKKDYENTLFKVKQIEEVCTNFRKHLEKIKPLVEQYELNKKKKNEDNKESVVETKVG